MECCRFSRSTILAFTSAFIFAHCTTFMVVLTSRVVFYTPKGETYLPPILNQSVYSCSDDRPLHFFIHVVSAPGNRGKRETARETWMRYFDAEKIKLTVRFVIGTKVLSSDKIKTLEEEEKTYRDLVLAKDLRDGYDNLPAKNLKAMQWAYNTSLNYDYYMKVDDDSYVQVTLLDRALRQQNCSKKLYMGFFYGYMPVLRSGRNQELDWFLCQVFVPYAAGPGYILSRDVVEIILNVSSRIKLYNNEDVATGTWLVPYKLHKTHTCGINVHLGKDCYSRMIVYHWQTREAMAEKYRNQVERGNPCPTSVETDHVVAGYYYNFNTLPGYCCRHSGTITL